MLCIGGVNSREQLDRCTRGTHVIVATPGRLSDMISKGKVVLDQCLLLVLDEAERMLELSFQQELKQITDGLPTEK